MKFWHLGVSCAREASWRRGVAEMRAEAGRTRRRQQRAQRGARQCGVAHLTVAPHVPQEDSLVARAAGEHVALRADLHRKHCGAVAGEEHGGRIQRRRARHCASLQPRQRARVRSDELLVKPRALWSRRWHKRCVCHGAARNLLGVRRLLSTSTARKRSAWTGGCGCAGGARPARGSSAARAAPAARCRRFPYSAEHYECVRLFEHVRTAPTHPRPSWRAARSKQGPALRRLAGVRSLGRRASCGALLLLAAQWRRTWPSACKTRWPTSCTETRRFSLSGCSPPFQTRRGAQAAVAWHWLTTLIA